MWLQVTTIHRNFIDRITQKTKYRILVVKYKIS